MMLLIAKNLRKRSNPATTVGWIMNLCIRSKPGAGFWSCVPIAVLRLWEAVETPIVNLTGFPTTNSGISYSSFPGFADF
jgi:hypothetical protein